jgi:hypothetical protein
MEFNPTNMDLKVICTDKGRYGITYGKVYNVVYYDKEYLHILNDKKEWDFFPYSCFKEIDEHRLEKIDQILGKSEL